MMWKTFVVLFIVGVVVESSPFGYMCRSNGRGDIADEVDKKINDAVKCVNNLFNLVSAKQDFLEALPTGSVSSVAKKYCPKASELKVCINQYYSAAAPCLQKFIQDNIEAVYNSTGEAIDFVCYNDGERVNAFIAEGGYQCIQEKSGPLRECGSSVTDVPPDNSPNSHEVHCRIFSDIETCVTSTLEGCPTSAAANVAKTLFGIARKSHSCPK